MTLRPRVTCFSWRRCLLTSLSKFQSVNLSVNQSIDQSVNQTAFQSLSTLMSSHFWRLFHCPSLFAAFVGRSVGPSIPFCVTTLAQPHFHFQWTVISLGNRTFNPYVYILSRLSLWVSNSNFLPHPIFHCVLLRKFFFLLFPLFDLEMKLSNFLSQKWLF